MQKVDIFHIRQALKQGSPSQRFYLHLLWFDLISPRDLFHVQRNQFDLQNSEFKFKERAIWIDPDLKEILKSIDILQPFDFQSLENLIDDSNSNYELQTNLFDVYRAAYEFHLSKNYSSQVHQIYQGAELSELKTNA